MQITLNTNSKHKTFSKSCVLPAEGNQTIASPGPSPVLAHGNKSYEARIFQRRFSNDHQKLSAKILSFNLAIMLLTFWHQQSALAFDEAELARLKADPDGVASWPIDFKSKSITLMRDALNEEKRKRKQLDLKVAQLTKSLANTLKAKSHLEKEVGDLALKVSSSDQRLSVEAEKVKAAEAQVQNLQSNLETREKEIADSQARVEQLSVQVAELKKEHTLLVSQLTSDGYPGQKINCKIDHAKRIPQDKWNAHYLQSVSQKVLDVLHYEDAKPPAGTVYFTISDDGSPIMESSKNGSPDSEPAVSGENKVIERLVKKAGPFHPLIGSSSKQVIELAFKRNLEGYQPTVTMKLALKPNETQEK